VVRLAADETFPEIEALCLAGIAYEVVPGVGQKTATNDREFRFESGIGL
jgi:siroheme synthase